MNTTTAVRAPSGSVKPLVLLSIPLIVLLWAYWPTLNELATTWTTNPVYSFGYLVPVFAIALLWFRRDLLDTSAFRASWIGLPFLALGMGLRLFGAYYHYVWLDPISLIPSLIGLWLMVGGWAAWRWAWPALLFLGFMVPLPYSFSLAMSGPLQRIATIASTFIMQVMGLPAIAEGNTIQVNENNIEIVQACNGLSMLMVFFALATAMAILLKRPVLDRLILVASAIPIAIIANIIRITVTGILYETVETKFAQIFFHDVAGWLMMPLALGMLWIEFKILQNLFLEPIATPARQVREPASRRTPASPRPPRPTRTPPPARETVQVRVPADPQV